LLKDYRGRFNNKAGNLKSVLSHIPVALLDKQDAEYLKAENHILQWGGMPALLSLNDPDR